jgi:protein-tyrosine phosphatase
VIDLHFHLLPGIDDGPPTLEASIELARAAVDAGVHTVVATPHVNWDFPNQAAIVRERTAEVSARLQELQIPLQVQSGAEIALTLATELDDEELRQLALGGGPWLLLECPPIPAVAGLEGLVTHMQERGHRVVLAHPERSMAFLRDPAALQRLVDAGALSSVTAGSLVGRFGGEVRRFSRELARTGLIHNVASDAHDTVRRPPGLVAELTTSGLEPRRSWLTQAVPAAVLAGQEIPPPPADAAYGADKRDGGMSPRHWARLLRRP